VTSVVQVPPRRQLESDSSAGSEEDDKSVSRVQGAFESTNVASHSLPPLKKEKQKRKGVGGGWFDGGVEQGTVAFAAETGVAEIDDFAGWEGKPVTFQKRKPRALDSFGFRSTAMPSVPKVNTHFMTGAGVSDF